MKLQKLEAVRGFAAAYVVAHHLFNQHCLILGYNFSFLFKFGQEAVMLFFILSGFVIHYSWQRSPDKRFSIYFEKRFLRIYIPLIIVLLTHYLIYSQFSKPLAIVVWKQVLGNLFMLQDVSYMKPNVICEPFLNNGPLWSLGYEWWFYMLYFVISRYFERKAFQVVSLLALTGTVTYIFYPFFLNRLLMYFIIWWLGAELANLYLKQQRITLRNLRKPLFQLLGCLGLLMVNWVIHFERMQFSLYPFLEVRHLGFALVVIVTAMIWKNYGWLHFGKTLGLFTFLAPVSYTIYISHYFLIVTPDYLNFIGNKSLQTLVGIVICLLFSYMVEVILYPFIIRNIRQKRSRQVPGQGHS